MVLWLLNHNDGERECIPLGPSAEGLLLRPEYPQPMGEPIAVVLLSGGMDSATALAMTRAEGFEVIALTFDYGQRHRKEILAAKRLVKHYRVKDHRTVSLDLASIGGSALTDRRIPIPENRGLEEIGRGIPSTYVPARNTILLSYALGLAEAKGARASVIAAQ